MTTPDSDPISLISLHPSICADILDTFIHSLDPETPTYCAEFYRSCFKVSASWTDLQILRATSFDFFTVALRFLTYQRTNEDLHRLDQRMSICQCIPTRPLTVVMHDIQHEGPSNLETLFNAISYTLARCFRGAPTWGDVVPLPMALDTSRKRAKKAHMKGRRPPWPEKTTDLLIYPPEQMSAMLWQIFHTYEASHVLFFLKTITIAAGSTFASAIQSLPFFPRQYMSHLERAIFAEDQFIQLGSFARFLKYITQQSGYHDSMQLAIWLPHVQDMIALLTKAIAALPQSHAAEDDTGLEPIIPCLVDIAVTLISTYKSSITLDLSHCAPEILQKLADSQESRGNGFIIQVAWAHVRNLARSDQCHMPGCSETFSTQNRRFSACGGCGIVSYCSKACQTDDWRYPLLPHRALCKPLHAYSKRFGLNWQKVGSRDAAAVMAMSEEAGVTEEEAAALIKLLHRKTLVIPEEFKDIVTKGAVMEIG